MGVWEGKGSLVWESLHGDVVKIQISGVIDFVYDDISQLAICPQTQGISYGCSQGRIVLWFSRNKSIGEKSFVVLSRSLLLSMRELRLVVLIYLSRNHTHHSSRYIKIDHVLSFSIVSSLSSLTHSKRFFIAVLFKGKSLHFMGKWWWDRRQNLQ